MIKFTFINLYRNITNMGRKSKVQVAAKKASCIRWNKEKQNKGITNMNFNSQKR